MKRAAVSIAFLLSSLTLAAQNNPSPQGDTVVPPKFQLQPPPKFQLQGSLFPPGFEISNCPISLHASQGVWNHTIAVRKGLGNERFGQRIFLTLQNAGIVSATVRVRGLNGKNHVLETPVNTGENWNAIRTMTVTFAAQDNGSVSGDLWITGFTSVSSIQLLEISYADGSVWKSSGQSPCRVQPDPVMLISNR